TTIIVFLFAYLNLNRWHWHFSYAAFAWVIGLMVMAGVATFDPAIAAGIARLSFAVTAVAGLGLIGYFAFQGYDRAVMLIPSWLMILAWLAAAYLAVSGRIDNDIIQPALGGGLVLV